MDMTRTDDGFDRRGGVVQVADHRLFDEWMYRSDFTDAVVSGDAANEANRRLVMDFEIQLARIVWERRVDRDIDALFERFLSEDYLQHDPPIGNGRERLAAWFRKGGAGPTPPPPVAITASQDLVSVLLQLPEPLGDRLPSCLTATYRIRGEQLCEHWGVLSLVMAVLECAA